VIYLDHHAATPMSARVLEAMARAHDMGWANPQSVHAAGRRARSLVEQARAQVATSIGAKAADIVFTSGGTEACNLALFGYAPLHEAHKTSILTTAIEHPAMSVGIARLEAAGAKVKLLDATAGRAPTPAEFASELEQGVTLAVVQWVNHETGTLFPIADYAREAAQRSVPILVDACQAYGRLEIDVGTLGVNALVIAASKIGGPKGAGALWVERCRELSPLLAGGAQEKGRRPGTPDVASLVGFGSAAEGIAERVQSMGQLSALRDRLEAGAIALGGVVNGGDGARAASVTNLSFRGWRGEHLVAALDIEGLCASSGAACSSGLGAPSPVLRALYPAEAWRAESALRMSLGPETTEAEVDEALSVLSRVLSRVV